MKIIIDLTQNPVTVSLLVFVLGLLYHLYNTKLRSDKVLTALIVVQLIVAVIVVALGLVMARVDRSIYLLAVYGVTRAADIVTRYILKHIEAQERKPLMKRLDNLQEGVKCHITQAQTGA